MATWSQIEQLMLELVNRARLDPVGEATRFGIDLNAGLAAGTLNGTAKQVLAPNSLLNDSARAHSQWMLDTDIFSHTGIANSDPGTRMATAGYLFTGAWTWGENIAWAGTTGTLDVNQYIVDEHQNLFLSAHHRENILNGDFREVGIGALSGNFTGYNALMVTQNFAKSGSSSFVTGVVYDDSDSNHFYSLGEGRSGITVQVTLSGATTSGTSASAGGYGVATGSGTALVTFSGGTLAAAISVTVDTTAGNAKADLVGGSRLELSATSTLGANAKDAALLGVAGINLTGNAAANILSGNAGANTISGGEGNDSVAGGLGNDQLLGGPGGDTLNGGGGNDVISGHNGYDNLSGATGNDTLGGGSGCDVLWGGAGKDLFWFNAALGATNVDRIGDFSVVDDQIRLDHLVFSGLATGALAASAFVVGTAAATGSQHVIYDTAAGALYFDADGVGGAAQVKFATVSANLSISAADFSVI